MLITFCVIAYNEEKSIGNLLDNLCSQTYPHKDIEVVLVDGMSSDNTKKILLEFKYNHENEFRKIHVLDNTGETLPRGWNVALANYSGEAILRVDAHAEIPEDFVEKNVKTLKAGHDICGGKVTSYITDKSKMAQIVNASENSMFGGSIATFRRADTTRYVDTLAFGIYRKKVFDKVGFYNENLARTEDNDMHYRMRKAGFSFYYNPEIVSYRETRKSFEKLLKQKFMNGYWIGLTMGVTPNCFSLYHFVPVAFFIAIILTTLLFIKGIWIFAALMWGMYFLLTITMSIMSVINNKLFSMHALALPIFFLMLHLSYGIGTFVGLVYMPFWKTKLKKRSL
jgi:glycosyltransferase involved in cell wall biosynthesis